MAEELRSLWCISQKLSSKFFSSFLLQEQGRLYTGAPIAPNLGLAPKMWHETLFDKVVHLNASCVCYFYMHVFADYVTCKWHHSLFVTSIIIKCVFAGELRTLLHTPSGLGKNTRPHASPHSAASVPPFGAGDNAPKMCLEQPLYKTEPIVELGSWGVVEKYSWMSHLLTR